MTPPKSMMTSAYRNVSLDSRLIQHDSYQLVNMMYETILECLTVARGAIEQGNIEVKIKKINQAIRILQEGLYTSLDLKQGGELAQNLAALYDYCVARLTQANAKNDAALLQEVSTLIKTVADGWSQLRQPKTEATVTTPVNNEKPQGGALRNLLGSYSMASTQRTAMAGA